MQNFSLTVPPFSGQANLLTFLYRAEVTQVLVKRPGDAIAVSLPSGPGTDNSINLPPHTFNISSLTTQTSDEPEILSSCSSLSSRVCLCFVCLPPLYLHPLGVQQIIFSLFFPGTPSCGAFSQLRPRCLLGLRDGWGFRGKSSVG